MLVWRVRVAGGDVVPAGPGRLRLVNVSFVPLELAEAVRARRDDILCFLGASPPAEGVCEDADSVCDEATGLARLLAAFPGAVLVDEECGGP